jgi:hypothetical protein
LDLEREKHVKIIYAFGLRERKGNSGEGEATFVKYIFNHALAFS